MKMALRKPRTALSMGLSDTELAEALGISLKRLVDALNEAGLCRCPENATHQQAKAIPGARKLSFHPVGLGFGHGVESGPVTI